MDSEYITWLTIGPQPTDTTTLIPFLKDAEEHLRFKYKNITADAGYESEENYLFLESNGQLSYIKPANYEISKTCKYKNNIGKAKNMEYDSEAVSYTSRNSKKQTADHIGHPKNKTGYVSEKTFYKCADCSGCPYKSNCIKGNNCKTPIEERTKTLQVAKTFLKHRKEMKLLLQEFSFVKVTTPQKRASVKCFINFIELPEEGSCLEDLIEYSTDYHYLVVKPILYFYCIEDDNVRIICILNEK